MRKAAIFTTVVALSTAGGFFGAGMAQASEELAKKSGCLTCHNVSGAKKMGPSFKDAAPAGEEKILAALNDKKKHGSVKASDDDKKTLAKWIASLK
jgi:cytochrome c